MTNFVQTLDAIADANPGQNIHISGTIAAATAGDAGTYNVVLILADPSGNLIGDPAFVVWGANITVAALAVSGNITLPSNAVAGKYTVGISVRTTAAWAWQTVTGAPATFNSPVGSVVTHMPLYGTYAPKLTLLKAAGLGDVLAGVGFLPDSGDTWISVAAATDEFDGTGIDLAKWRTRLPGGWDHYNDELERYADSGITVNGGSCKLTGHALPYNPAAPGHAPSPTGFNYPFFSSGCISSHALMAYGYFEARMKFPKGQGVWPAFWMLPNTNYQGEIDIVEYVFNGGTEHQNMIHNNNLCNWPGSVAFFAEANYNVQYGYWMAPASLSPTYFVDDWHVVGCYWNEIDNTTTIYIDGYPVSQRRLGPAGQLSAVIFNLAIGGGWPTTNANGQAWTQPVDLTDQVFEISYFRAFQKMGKSVTGSV